jgi:hypothetical protein
VSSAAVVPKAAIGRLYGRYTETARVSRVTTGYKSAHLLWPHGNGAFEVDFPENEWNTAPYAYVHNGNDPQLSFPSNVSWAQWHTYTIGWRPGLLSLYVDGKLIGRTSSATYVPSVPMDWIIQNESALNGEQAPDRHQLRRIRRLRGLTQRSLSRLSRVIRQPAAARVRA